ncbi:MAG: hypothetical protein HY541_01370 [Deltaproteobacteria bacterium]|nr:hypothetical protein [Deltaproteobacteria bacterium]
MPPSRKSLPKDIARVLLKLAENLFPRSEFDLQGIEHDLVKNCERMIAEFPKCFRWGFFLGIRLFEWLPFLFGFGFSRFSSLPEPRQMTYVDHWALCRFIPKREFFKTLRAFVMLVVFSDKRVWEYIGYDPEPHIKQRIQMRKDFLAQEDGRKTV